MNQVDTPGNPARVKQLECVICLEPINAIANTPCKGLHPASGDICVPCAYKIQTSQKKCPICNKSWDGIYEIVEQNPHLPQRELPQQRALSIDDIPYTPSRVHGISTYDARSRRALFNYVINTGTRINELNRIMHVCDTLIEQSNSSVHRQPLYSRRLYNEQIAVANLYAQANNLTGLPYRMLSTRPYRRYGENSIHRTHDIEAGTDDARERRHFVNTFIKILIAITTSYALIEFLTFLLNMLKDD